ncbi:threonine--tRNA ligase [Candidatus Peregrinibacteria bacterium]|nr:threonine--tRNA ligase [Candidatus Peregrinibacteria bacterium]
MAKKERSEVARSEDQQLDYMRHSCAHMLAQAVLEMFPDAKLGIGPTTDDGFYYDFDLPRTLIPEDLKLLQEKMERIAKEKQPFKRVESDVDKAIEFYKAADQPYKVDIAEGLKKEGENMVTFYENVLGDEVKFSDLCRGGHTEDTRGTGAFKLTKIAGAYWRGDENQPMLQRIYGLCFKDKKELKAHIQMLEEAKKRDHRKLGKELDLFTFSELVGPGLPLWTPRGTLLRNLLDDYVWQLRKERGYMKVAIPHITKKELYETSGHWQKFADDLFRIKTREDHEFAMKPMNCPHHTQIYDSRQRSYKDLPQRYAETTMVYRDEQTGELHGLSRVRSITQDDAHVFCRTSQMKEEFLKIWDIIEIFYKAVGFGDLKLRLSLHDPDAFDKYLGTPELWQEAENSLREIADEKGVDYFEAPGEAAFYGPKMDFMTKDSIGREWQVATIQLDINMPERFDLFCINEEGEQERIVMVHAAIMGSIERFMSIFIEHHAGAFPLWLAPTQVRILPVSDKFLDYASEVKKRLEESDVRVEIDDSNEGLGKKIRNAEMEKVPYMLVVGEKEVESKQVAVRNYQTKKQNVMDLDAFVEGLLKEIQGRELETQL